MPRYVAFLRGVSPLNARMAELRACFEGAGFAAVRTVIASGNVVFDSTLRSEAAVERAAEAALRARLERPFPAIVRSVDVLERLLADDPFARHRLSPKAKRVVTFLREAAPPKPGVALAGHDAEVLLHAGRDVLTAYVPGDAGPVFMRLIENAFGKDVTTRTWETVRKCAAA